MDQIKSFGVGEVSRTNRRIQSDWRSLRCRMAGNGAWFIGFWLAPLRAPTQVASRAVPDWYVPRLFLQADRVMLEVNNKNAFGGSP
jgi:hypothetical protein